MIHFYNNNYKEIISNEINIKYCCTCIYIFVLCMYNYKYINEVLYIYMINFF